MQLQEKATSHHALQAEISHWQLSTEADGKYRMLNASGLIFESTLGVKPSTLHR